LVLITVKHVLTTLQDEFKSALIGKGPADVLNDNAVARDDMLYKNFKVVMDKQVENFALLWDKQVEQDTKLDGIFGKCNRRKLETISSGPNLEMDKFEAVVTEMVSAEVTTVIEAQQSENKARMAEMKAELKAQQTESNQKLNALEAMVAQLIEQNRQLLDSIVGAGEKEE